MIKDLPECQTHSYGDGCGEKAHNAPKEDCGCVEIGTGKIPKYCPKHLKENLDPMPSSPNKTIEVSKEIYGDKEWMSDFVFVMESLGAARPTKEPEKWEQLLVLIEVKKRESHAAGVEEFRKKAIEAVTTVFKEISDLNIDGDEKYWKVEAFGYAPHDMEASKDKFFPKEVKGKLLAALNKLTP
jgi:hypothetical protein